MTTTMTRSDAEIQQDITREFRWDTRVGGTQIGVGVQDGIVMLSGTVDSYARKIAAREAAHRVPGVLDVADEIEVRLPAFGSRTDEDIARAVRFALEWDVFVPDQKIRTTVSDGWVTLEGDVETLVDHEDAELAIRRLHGVRGVSNQLRVRATPVDAGEIRATIEQTLSRRAHRQADRIKVDVEDGRVTLVGRVHSWPEREAILGSVSHAPGIQRVTDRLRIEPYL